MLEEEAGAGRIPKFTVVMPLYNKENCVLRALRSALGQACHDLELIVVDDGSTDSSLEAVATVQDERLTIITQENGGESAARNRGVASASGRYVAFLDADDAWDPSFLTIVEDLITQFPDAGGYATRIRDSMDLARDPSYGGRVGNQSRMVADYLELLNSGVYLITSSSVCIKNSVLREVGGFDETLHIGPDIDMWIKVHLHSGFAVSPVVAATYHTDAENRSIHRPSFSLEEINFFQTLRERYLGRQLELSSRHALDQWSSMRIHQVIIRLIYQGQKADAARALGATHQHLRLGQILYVIARLCLPNAAVEGVKRLARTAK